MAMPFITGLMNIVVPLQIGARDVAYLFLNSLSFWLFGAGVVLMMVSLFVGEFAATGWLAYPPLSAGLQPQRRVDYYIWALQISGLGTTLSGINFIVTILRMRAPGMSLMKMPIFTWTSLVTNVLIVAAFPVLAATLALLTMDRYLGTHFFTNDMGGNVMMYVNLIWIWGHPEVYILVLPASACTRKWSPPSPARRCSATNPWFTPRPPSACCRSWSGCTTSSPWAREPTSMPSSA